MQNYQVNQSALLSGFGTGLHYQFGISQGKSQTLSHVNASSGQERREAAVFAG